ncbi:hypothetical protein BDQ12DRAFT_674342 [Crucibulum laeve]|uniref:Uncharacterized protein n=1 Tax=Crucibulum laeve TaxID=68775 RepID=A0A5C3MEL8_9AGAR|nr:hypothetical protein BDQ12DRAFT_674342 [Crucibulum laeve]
MTKPTIMQTLLNKPSQTYSFPQEKAYFSTRKEMLRIASEAQSPALPKTSGSVSYHDYNPLALPTPPPQQLKYPQVATRHNHYKPIKEYTLETSQEASSSKVDSCAHVSAHSRPSIDISSQFVDQEDEHEEQEEDGLSSSPESDQDVFFTPNQSPRTSMASVQVALPFPVNPPPRKTSRRSLAAEPTSSTAKPISNSVTTATPNPPTPISRIPVPSTRTRTNVASISSLSTTSLDAHSMFSDVMSDETRVTTPLSSEEGHGYLGKGGFDYTYTARKGKGKDRRDYVYTDEDWAKDVRWLAPPNAGAKATVTPTPGEKRRVPGEAKEDKEKDKDGHFHLASINLHLKSSSLKRDAPEAQKPEKPVYFTASKGTPLPPGQQRKSVVIPGVAGMVQSMSSVLEEDEEGASGVAGLGSGGALGSGLVPGGPTRRGNRIGNGRGQVPRSSVLIAGPSRLRVASSPGDVSSLSGSSKSGTTSQSIQFANQNGRARSELGSGLSKTSKPPMRRRRSKSLEHVSPPSVGGSYTSHTSEASLSARGDLPSQGTAGYTSLVLPRAPVPLSSVKTGTSVLDGKIDLTRSGVAQTTMASVEVVRGLGGKKGGIMGMFGLARAATKRRAFSASGERRARSEDSVGLNGGVVDSVLGFTSYRKPPGYVPSGSVLVQVWAVGVDGVDGRLVGVSFGSGTSSVEKHSEEDEEREEDQTGQTPKRPTLGALGRSVSLRSKLGRVGSMRSTKGREKDSNPKQEGGKEQNHRAEVGYIPGRSFVGRVLECGWEVKEEIVRKGEWVVGLLDVRKSGALTEFIVIDRHRIHRVPHPRKDPPVFANSANNNPLSRPPPPSQTASSSSSVSSRSHSTARPPLSTLSLEELALLPLCGVPAYRAMRTFMFAFSSTQDDVNGDINTRLLFDLSQVPTGSAGTFMRQNSMDHDNGRRRRALVLRGHDGAGAMVVQMLVQRGWRVSVHAPLAVPSSAPQDDTFRYMAAIEDRVRAWGGEEVVFDDGDIGADDGRGAVVRMIERLRADGDSLDAVLDTVGGKEVREAAERLLRAAGTPSSDGLRTPMSADGKSTLGRVAKRKTPMGHFTTLVGDAPDRTIPTAADHFRAGLRSLRFGGDASKAEDNEVKSSGKVGYAWVSIAQDVDWEGQHVGESIGVVLRMALESGIRPWIGSTIDEEDTDCAWGHKKLVPFENTPGVFVDNGPLGNGGTVVVKVAA